MASRSELVQEPGEQVTLDTLIDRLGPGAAEEFFGRVDGTLREGRVIHTTNVRGARSQAVFTKARNQGQAQLVLPGKAGRGRRREVDVGESVVIMKMDDFEAVVRAGRSEFDWAVTFAPRSGLAAASTSAPIVRGSRGSRQLRG